jgi:hypothetical protein
MTTAIFEEFLSPSTMIEAEQELVALGDQALPVLESLLTGDAKNRFGVPYRTLGLPLRCTLEVVRRLGPVAKPLERYLRDELKSGDPVAAMALGSLGKLEEASLVELAAVLQDENSDLSLESASALVRCGATHHPAVLKAMNESQKARDSVTRATNTMTNAPPMRV